MSHSTVACVEHRVRKNEPGCFSPLLPQSLGSFKEKKASAISWEKARLWGARSLGREGGQARWGKGNKPRGSRGRTRQLAEGLSALC